MRRYRTFFMVAVAALALSGCGGSSSDSVSDGGVGDVSSNDGAGQGTYSDVEKALTEDHEIKMVSMSEIRAAAEIFSDTYDKLDFSETVFTIPETDTASWVSFGEGATEPEQMDEVEEKLLLSMSHMGGSGGYEALRYMNGHDDEGARILTPASDLESAEKLECDDLVYNDGRYVALSDGTGLQASDNLFWMGLCGNSDSMNEDFYQPWYAGFEGSEEIAVYNLPEDSIEGVSYELFDGETLLSDAVEFVLEDAKNYCFVTSDYVDTEVGEVYVYQTADGPCYYDFYMTLSLNGIEIKDYTDDSYDIMEDTGELGFTNASIRTEFTMAYSDGINFIWTFGLPNFDVEKEEITEFVSLEDAAYIIDEAISEDAVFNITDVTMTYQLMSCGSTTTSGDWERDHYEYRFAYLFHVSNPKVLGYSALYFCVDVQTGQFFTLAKTMG